MIMDIKDAHKVTENLQTRPFICSENTIELYNGYIIAKKEYFQELQEAREEQTPKKPIRVDVGHNGSSTDGCPVCKREFYEKFNFCPDCGTSLYWSD